MPFSSMGYQVVDGRAVMGFSVTRTIVRNAESIVHPRIAPDWGPGGVAKPTQMRKMVITGLDAPSKPLYLTPYVLGGGGLSTSPAASGTGYDQDTQRVTELGGDLRYALHAESQPRSLREHGFRPGRGGRPAGEPHALLPVLSGAAPGSSRSGAASSR